MIVSDTQQSIDDLEAELLALENQLAEKRKRVAIAKSKPSPTALQAEFNKEADRASEVGQRDPIEALRDLLDIASRRLEYMEVHNGPNESYTGPNYYANLCTQKGRVQGIAAALAVVSRNSVKSEMIKSIERRVDSEQA